LGEFGAFAPKPHAGDPPEQNAIYLVGESTPLLYKGRVYYSTVFDNNQLIAILREKGAAAAMDFLYEKKVRFVGINFAEIARFANTYGFEANQTALRDRDAVDKYMNDLSAALQPLLERLTLDKEADASAGTHMFHVPPKK
jgi:hypothetical protein